MSEFDEDVVVVGSGFGGAVAALRLSEKGYRVRVIEAGRRFEDADFARTSWDVRRYLWAPALGCFGVQRIHRLPHVMILAGAGVGGGSLNYANTLYQPGAAFFADPQWPAGVDWQGALEEHYSTARRMLGVVEHYPHEGPVERIMRAAAADLGVEHTFRAAPVGVFLGTPGVRVPDPFFDGAGPARTGCTLCGNCMVGCRVGAKNTLMKNYLALAERRGAVIEALRTVTEISEDPRGGFRVTTRPSGAWTHRRTRTIRAEQVVLAAGTWGTQQLLHRMRASGALPRLSAALGRLTRTNSEALDGAVATRVPARARLAEGVAITTSFHIDERTHVENVRYGPGSNLMGALATLLVRGERALPLRLAAVFGALARHPLRQLSLGSLRRWSERSIIALVMQSADNSLTLSLRRRWGRPALTSVQGHGEPNPSFLPQAHVAASAIARRMQEETGVHSEARGSWPEVFGIPLTAHFLGGAVLSDSPDGGVVDAYHRVWGHPGLHVVDGAAVPANPGVNPSLTITALAERAMSHWPCRGARDLRPAQTS
ncbi:GMC family oxidoreductase [Microbacterium sp. USHLN186]|uniref:GMC family oxidoreductase n=1 Tax=Microbacterium sp. USHLN186 TaxID=3081286 RepID=UPI003019E799